jgi:hypothetical protein
VQTGLQAVEQTPIRSQAAVHLPVTRDQPPAHCPDSLEAAVKRPVKRQKRWILQRLGEAGQSNTASLSRHQMQPLVPQG